MSTEKPENLQVTPVADIIKKANSVIREGVLVELPSGIVMRVARPKLATLLRSGKIPQSLTSAALRQAEGRRLLTQDEVKESLEVLEIVLMEAVKEPKIVKGTTPKEGEITFDHLTDDDQGFLFQFVQSGNTDLRPFRPVGTK